MGSLVLVLAAFVVWLVSWLFFVFLDFLGVGGGQMSRFRIVGNLTAPCLTTGCHILVLLLLLISRSHLD